MYAVAHDSQPAALQPGYRAVPLETLESPASLRLAVVVKESPEPVGGPFVSLGETLDASIYLGCVVDASGQVHDWLEIWIQNIEQVATRHPAQADLFCNALLDSRWSRAAEHWRAMDPAAFIATGWETTHPSPLFLDLGLQHARIPRDMATGATWLLCTDDRALAAAGLPPYSTSLARYLALGSANGGEARFVPITSDAPENAATVSLKEAVGNLVPLNPAGGLMMVRRLAPLALDEWSDVLSGAAWKGLAHGRKAMRLSSPYNTLQDAGAIQQGVGHFLLSLNGRAGRLLEAYHLKVQTLLAAAHQTRAWIQREQLPLLNLTLDSFRIAIRSTDEGLPFLWNAATRLSRPGHAMALPVQSTGARYFIEPLDPKSSVFRPLDVNQRVEGQASLRVRSVQVDDAAVTVEGTLVTDERVKISAHDLLSLQFALPSGRVELYGRWVETSEGLSVQELRFQTLPQVLGGAVLTAIREAEGVAIPQVRFTTFPVISTPGDLYAFAVIAMRLLLVNDEVTLPVLVDELLSFGRLVAEQHDPAIPLAQRVATLAESDARWQAALGPQRLLTPSFSPEEALSLFSPELWWETIGIILRLVPGLGPDSYCRDFGDASPLALERVFDAPIEALSDLSVRSRSLIAIDWNQNREIRSVIETFLARTNQE
jgi:hypothetical protein